MSALRHIDVAPPHVVQAISLARHGVAVFPCLENKCPATPHGFKDAVSSPDEAATLWQRYPGPLIGVATGAVSGIDVLDLDLHKEGADEWHSAHCTYLPRTRTHGTRSGGLHMLFRHREGMRNSASRIAEGIDVRGDGGYIIWWPAAGLDIMDRSPAAQWPAWLAEQAMPPPPSKMDPAATEQTLRDADRYAAGAVRAAIQSVLTAPQGRRNDTLNGEVYSLARFVPQGLLTAGQIAQAMAAAGLQAGLNQREIEKTIASALRARIGA